jgi:hypothetical protein
MYLIFPVREFPDMERYFGEGARIGNLIFWTIVAIVSLALYFCIYVLRIEEITVWASIFLITVLSVYVIVKTVSYRNVDFN